MSTLLDTDFLFRLLNERDSLHAQAIGYYSYYLEGIQKLCLSTISVAEYATAGTVGQLPLEDLHLLPFNIEHAACYGELFGLLMRHHEATRTLFTPTPTLGDDLKLLAQAQVEKDIDGFLTADESTISLYSQLQALTHLTFKIIDARKGHQETFGVLF